MQILHIDSSIQSDASASRALGAAIIEELRRSHPAATVIHRDLVIDPIPHHRRRL